MKLDIKDILLLVAFTLSAARTIDPTVYAVKSIINASSANSPEQGRVWAVVRGVFLLLLALSLFSVFIFCIWHILTGHLLF